MDLFSIIIVGLAIFVLHKIFSNSSEASQYDSTAGLTQTHTAKLYDTIDKREHNEYWRSIDEAPRNGHTFICGWVGYVSEMAMWDIGTRQFVKAVWQQSADGSDNTPTPFEVPPTHYVPNIPPPIE